MNERVIAPRILFWDLETSGLKADMEHLICFASQFADEPKPRIISLLDFPKDHARDPSDDKALCKAAYKRLVAADLWVFHYGKYFDSRFMRSRLAQNGHKPLPPIKWFDTWEAARNHFALGSNRLDALADFLNISDRKTYLNKRIWRRARTGHVPSIRYVNKHGYADIILLKKVYDQLKVIVPAYFDLRRFNLNPKICAHCGHSRLVSQDIRPRLSTGGFVRRLQCYACFGWTYQKLTKSEVNEYVMHNVLGSSKTAHGT